MAPINMPTIAIYIQVYFLCVLVFPLKCDTLKEIHRKSNGYAYQSAQIIKSGLKLQSILPFSTKKIVDMISMHGGRHCWMCK